MPKRYSLPFKEKAKHMFFIMLGPSEIHRRMKALPEGETLTKTTVERWCRDWKPLREQFLEKAQAKTDEAALATIGEIVDENDTIRETLLNKILEGKAKPGSLEGLAYAVKAFGEQKLKITGADRKFKQKKEIVERETIIQGTFTERVRRAKQELEQS